MVSEQNEISEAKRSMQRIEEMLLKLLAEKKSQGINRSFQEGRSPPPPTSDPPDRRTRQISAPHLQPINHEGQIYPGNQATSYEFPKFNGTLIRDWFWRYEQLFFLNRTPPELMVHQASLYFEGKALQWHHEYIRNRYGRYPSWSEYIIDFSGHYDRNWDADIVDCNGWVGSNTQSDETVWNMQRIDDLKEYGAVYTPTVIDDNQMVAKATPDLVAHQVLDEITATLNDEEELAAGGFKASIKLSQDEETIQIEVEVKPIVAIGSTVPSAHQVFDKMSAQNESTKIGVSDYLNEPLDLAVSRMKVHEKREVMYEFSRLEAPQMLEEMQEEPSGLVVYLPFDEKSGLMTKGMCLLEVFPKEIMSAESAVSPTKGRSALMSFDPGGKWPPILAKCEIKEVVSMSDGDPNQIDEELMFNPSFLSINQPRLRADGLLGISPDIEKCIELSASDPDLRGAFSCVDSPGRHDSFNDSDVLLCFDPGIIAKRVKTDVATSDKLIDMSKKKVLIMCRATYFVLDITCHIFDLGFESQVSFVAGHERLFREAVFYPGGSDSVYVTSSNVSTRLKLKLAHYFRIDGIIWDLGRNSMCQVELAFCPDENVDTLINFKSNSMTEKAFIGASGLNIAKCCLVIEEIRIQCFCSNLMADNTCSHAIALVFDPGGDHLATAAAIRENKLTGGADIEKVTKNNAKLGKWQPSLVLICDVERRIKGLVRCFYVPWFRHADFLSRRCKHGI